MSRRAQPHPDERDYARHRPLANDPYRNLDADSAARVAARSYSSGGEYLRDAPEHREGWPDIEYEYERSGAGIYADDVVGGNYLRGYGEGRNADTFERYHEDERGDRGRPAYWTGRSRDSRHRLRTGYGERSGYAENAAPGDTRMSQYGSGHPLRGGFRGRGPRGYARLDERIREDLCERLMEDDAIDASDIAIAVQEGVVTLEGSVDERWVKHRVEDMAEACTGVKDIVNHLRVEARQPPGSSPHPG